MSPAKIKTLDIRPVIARGEEPFKKIREVIATLADGEELVLVTPFLPSPAIERLQADGFSARPERRPDGSWRTQFSRL